MTEDEFDELADRLSDKLGYDPDTFIRELRVRGRQHMRMTAAEVIAVGGADISEVAPGGGDVVIPAGYPASHEVRDALIQGIGIAHEAGCYEALREWAAEEHML
jgi:hypothetical protein